ncbi:hypothetical protein HAP47_0004985 [Bradyrhizobium sp. 41S5]|nr:hypothetical protein [Bradyrhizobium sp. 41S5]UFX48856.1 hypothetical protein HAP47_0004985 [Bradyrhizobium sp. 41S5]
MPIAQHSQPEPPPHDLPALEAARIGDAAKPFLSGLQRDATLRKARLVETASHINDWLTSPGLRTPS